MRATMPRPMALSPRLRPESPEEPAQSVEMAQVSVM